MLGERLTEHAVLLIRVAWISPATTKGNLGGMLSTRLHPTRIRPGRRSATSEQYDKETFARHVDLPNLQFQRAVGRSPLSASQTKPPRQYSGEAEARLEHFVGNRALRSFSDGLRPKSTLTHSPVRFWPLQGACYVGCAPRAETGRLMTLTACVLLARRLPVFALPLSTVGQTPGSARSD
jgi:hypothetical protein